MRGVSLRIFFLLLITNILFAQRKDSVYHLAEVNKRKLRTISIASGVGYGIGLIGLNELWYKDSEKQSFSFFNDNAEWRKVDKLGHFYSAFYLSYASSKSIKSCNVSGMKSDAWGSAIGFLMLLPIEIFDGYSADYGASTGDLAANAIGSGFYLGQSALWNEVRIQPKFSFRRTSFPPLRNDNVLGNGHISEIFKDYNGQTYWLSFDMDKFIRFPKWLNLALGYGADGMVYARETNNTEAGYSSFSQYYLGIDFDFTHVKTHSKALNAVLFVASIIKLPAPAIEFSKEGTTFRFFQF